MIRRNFLRRMGLTIPILWWPKAASGDAPIRDVTVQRNIDGSYSVAHKDLPRHTIIVTNFPTVGTALAYAERFLVQDQT